MNSEALTGRGAGGLRAAPRGPRRTDLGFRVIRRGMPSPEEEEVEAGEVRRLLMPAMSLSRAVHPIRHRLRYHTCKRIFIRQAIFRPA